MGWLDRMNRMLDYIEANLSGEIDTEEIGRIACCSAATAQRMFSYVAELPLSEYVRRRRLTQAAFELQNSGIKVVDMALRYGYESPEAFARAFQAIHGVTPTSARRGGVMLKAYPRLSFLLTLKGVVPMNYRIETKEGFQVYGIEGIFTTENGRNLTDIPAFWLKCRDDGSLSRLDATSGGKGLTDDMCAVNAICDYEEREGANFPYMLCAFAASGRDSTGYKVVDIPASTWAIFKSDRLPVSEIEKTSDLIQDLIKRVYTDWLPTAAYDKVDGCELEIYYSDGKEFWTETWIRVVPK